MPGMLCPKSNPGVFMAEKANCLKIKPEKLWFYTSRSNFGAP